MYCITQAGVYDKMVLRWWSRQKLVQRCKVENTANHLEAVMVTDVSLVAHHIDATQAQSVWCTVELPLHVGPLGGMHQSVECVHKGPLWLGTSDIHRLEAVYWLWIVHWIWICWLKKCGNYSCPKLAVFCPCTVDCCRAVSVRVPPECSGNTKPPTNQWEMQVLCTWMLSRKGNPGLVNVLKLHNNSVKNQI